MARTALTTTDAPANYASAVTDITWNAGIAGTPQAEEATVAGTASATGTAVVTVTAAGMRNSPKAVDVAITDTDDANTMATKIRAALAADIDVFNFFVVSGATDKVRLTARRPAANDSTMNIAIATGTATGLTAAPTSSNTTAGDVGGHKVVLSGADLILIRNAHATDAKYFSVPGVPDLYGHRDEILQESVAANNAAVRALPYYTSDMGSGWVQTDGCLYIDAEDSNIKIAVIRLSRR